MSQPALQGRRFFGLESSERPFFLTTENFLLSSLGIELSSVSPETGSPTGGTELVLYGRGFYAMRLHPPAIRVGAEKASGVRILSDTMLSCILPPGIGSRLTISLVPKFELLVPGLQGQEVVLGGVSLGLRLEKAISYDGEDFALSFGLRTFLQVSSLQSCPRADDWKECDFSKLLSLLVDFESFTTAGADIPATRYPREACRCPLSDCAAHLPSANTGGRYLLSDRLLFRT